MYESWQVLTKPITNWLSKLKTIVQQSLNTGLMQTLRSYSRWLWVTVKRVIEISPPSSFTRTTHSGNALPCRCEACAQSLTSKQRSQYHTIYQHERGLSSVRHSGDREYNCERCGQKFTLGKCLVKAKQNIKVSQRKTPSRPYVKSTQ